MINVFYYYYYLFYTKVLPDNQPHTTVIFTLSFSLSLFVNSLLCLISAKIEDYFLTNYIAFGIFAVITVVNYLVYYRTGRCKLLVREKPKFLNSHKLSILLTLIFSIISISYLFWGPIYLKNILTK